MNAHTPRPSWGAFWRDYWIRARACLAWIVKSWARPASSESRWQQDIGKKHWG